MNVHDIINIPGYGQANKRVKAMGMWRETMTDTERIEWIENSAASVVPRKNGGDFQVLTTNEEMAWHVLRGNIDEAATKHAAYLNENYLED